MASSFSEIYALHPHPAERSRELSLACVEACLECTASCTACADASVAEADPRSMAAVIRRCLDCADFCQSTLRVVLRQTAESDDVTRAAVERCAVACRECASECERHAMHHEHCRICAE